MRNNKTAVVWVELKSSDVRGGIKIAVDQREMKNQLFYDGN